MSELRTMVTKPDKLKVVAISEVDDDGFTVIKFCGLHPNGVKAWAIVKFLMAGEHTDEAYFAYARAKVTNALNLIRYHATKRNGGL